MASFIAARKADETKEWAELRRLTDPTALQRAIEQLQAKNGAACQTCQSLVSKIWESIEDKEAAYVKTLQDQSIQLHNLLKMLAHQSASLSDAATQQANSAEHSLQEVSLL